MKRKLISLALVFLLAASVFAGCSFPTYLEDGRFEFQRVRLSVNDLEITEANATRGGEKIIEWLDESFGILREQIPNNPLILFIFDIVSAGIRNEFSGHDFRSELVKVTRENENRFFVVRDGQIAPSRQVWHWTDTGGETHWVADNFSNFEIDTRGRIISNNIPLLLEAQDEYWSLRAFSQNRLVQTERTNARFIFDSWEILDLAEMVGLRAFDTSRIRDFWTTYEIIFRRG